jgi:hypothetical protein
MKEQETFDTKGPSVVLSISRKDHLKGRAPETILKYKTKMAASVSELPSRLIG